MSVWARLTPSGYIVDRPGDVASTRLEGETEMSTTRSRSRSTAIAATTLAALILFLLGAADPARAVSKVKTCRRQCRVEQRQCQKDELRRLHKARRACHQTADARGCRARVRKQLRTAGSLCRSARTACLACC